MSTRWWRRDDVATGVDVWGGPDEVTIAPTPRRAPEDAGVDQHAEREQAEREERERAQRERAERARAEQEQREQAERERAERERTEQEERERAERARAEQEERERAEQEQRERAERERAERERAERERAERERAERERAEREQREREERERAERERVERLLREREERERVDRERRERQRAEQERRVASRQEQARREREERERREREERERAERQATAADPVHDTADDTAVIPRVAGPEVTPDRVTTVPGAEAVSPRKAAAREAAAREAAAADRKRRRRRVLLIFLVAALAVAAVWIIPRLIALAVALVTSLVGTAAPETAPSDTAVVAVAPVQAQAELPRGGTSIAPDRRVVALRVEPAAAVEESADRLDEAATSFDGTERPVLPALELPVRDSADAPAAWRWLAVTRAHRQVLLLAVPAGSAGVGAAIEPWERLLREPDVGLALDADAPLPPDQVGAATDRLAVFVRDAALPQKLLVVPTVDTDPTVPAEVALVSSGSDDVEAPVLRGVVVAPDDPDAREILAAEPSPDAVLLR